ncbi:hypothetical protein ABIA39_009024 [Nocardia sp. GAS34]
MIRQTPIIQTRKTLLEQTASVADVEQAVRAAGQALLSGSRLKSHLSSTLRHREYDASECDVRYRKEAPQHDGRFPCKNSVHR